MNKMNEEWFSSSREGEETFTWDWVDFILCGIAGMLFAIALIRIIV